MATGSHDSETWRLATARSRNHPQMTVVSKGIQLDFMDEVASSLHPIALTKSPSEPNLLEFILFKRALFQIGLGLE